MPVAYTWRDATRVVWVETRRPRSAPPRSGRSDAATGKKSKLFDAPAVKTRDGKEKTSSRSAARSSVAEGRRVRRPLRPRPLARERRRGGEAKRLTDDAEDESAPGLFAGRNAPRVREEARPLRPRCRPRQGDAPHEDGQRRRPERRRSTGSTARSSRSRRGSRSFVWSPDSSRDRVPRARPDPRPDVPDRRLHADERKARVAALPEGGRPERDSVRPRRGPRRGTRRRPSRPRRTTSTSPRSSRGRRTGRASASSSSTARRRTSTSSSCRARAARRRSSSPRATPRGSTRSRRRTS